MDERNSASEANLETGGVEAPEVNIRTRLRRMKIKIWNWIDNYLLDKTVSAVVLYPTRLWHSGPCGQNTRARNTAP